MISAPARCRSRVTFFWPVLCGGGLGMSKPSSVLDHLSREELIERIGALEALVLELRAEIERLKRAGKRQATPFSKGERKKNSKRPGRKPGQGTFRHRARPDPSEITEPAVFVPVGEPSCSDCGGALMEERVELCWRTELPPLPRPEITEYRVSVARCDGCGKRVRGEHPEVAPDQRGATAHRLGPRLLSAAHVLHYGVGVPVRKVPLVLRELCGVELTQGALTQAALRAARQAAGSAHEAYEEIRSALPAAAAVYADPTGWRVGGKGAQLAVFETDGEVIYRITPRYRNEEVREVIGDAYAGVLITDRGRVFDARALDGVRQQKCLAHVLRSISEVTGMKKGRAKDFGLRLGAFLREALKAAAQWREGHITEEAYAHEALRIERELTHHLRDRAFRDADNQRLLNELGRHHDRGNLLRFLFEDEVEPTNNRAERALRPGVISRKVSQCSKTWGGAEAYAIFVSLIRTAVMREARSSVDALARMLATGKPPPIPAEA